MLDDKTKALIIKYLRKAWLYSPARRQVIKAAKTGGKDAQGEDLFLCKTFLDGTITQHTVTKVYVDHKQSMIPLSGFDSWDKLIERLFDVDNMQCLCKLHHKLKTDKENKVRNLGKKRAKKNGKV